MMTSFEPRLSFPQEYALFIIINASKKALKPKGDSVEFYINSDVLNFEQAKAVFPQEWLKIEAKINFEQKRDAGFDYVEKNDGSSIPSGNYPLMSDDRNGLNLVQTAFNNGAITTNLRWSNGVVTEMVNDEFFTHFVREYVNYTNVNLFGGT